MNRKLTILITGGNDGIGRATAQVLLERGHEVILAGRSQVKLEAAVATLKYRTEKSCISAIKCDLADLPSVRSAAAEFQQRYNKLDVLINNAGIFTNELQLSTDGIELQFAVNHLGHFLLTKLLFPQLEATPSARIINVASVAHFHAKLDFDHLHGEEGADNYNGLAAYARSKLANVLFTRELARRYPHLQSNCLHPGVIRTRIANKSTNWYYSLFWSLYKPFMRPTRCGARTSVYLSLSPEINGVTGRYFDEKQCCKKPSELARDPHLANLLWEKSEALIEQSKKRSE
jgi:NAD(P)-dependent dehydrogenase (short-subunit alcohol dehydrogenase family)